MLEALHYTFFQNALIAAILVSIASGIIGSLIVVNKMSFLTGGIAHSSYGGIGLAIFFGLPVFAGATLFALMSAFIIAFISFKQKEKIDIFIGLVWAVGMAIGIVLVDLTPGYHGDLLSYLFGSILAVSRYDLIFMAFLTLSILFFIHRYYREILAVSYDSTYASLKGIHAKLFYTLILLFSSLTIVAAIKVVGVILVIALMTIPTYIAQDLSNSLYEMMIKSTIFSTFFTLIGLLCSYYLNISSGAAIILISALFFILYIFNKEFVKK